MKYFEEAFTSENWIVRIYKVKPVGNRDNFRLIKNKQESYSSPPNSFTFKNYKYNTKVQLIKKRKVLV